MKGKNSIFMAAAYSPQIFRSAIYMLAWLVRINTTENCQGHECNCSGSDKTK